MSEWHKHKFLSGKLTPGSCIVCAHSKDAAQHKGYRKVATITRALNRPGWRIWQHELPKQDT